MSKAPVEYTEYLQLEKILNAQALESDKENAHAHDEMLFIIIHQAYELWFKQIHFEVDSALEILNKESVNDNSPELQTIMHRSSRVVTILKVLVHQIDILETMTPLDFYEFRDFLRPASGFQSWQFKILEASGEVIVRSTGAAAPHPDRRRRPMAPLGVGRAAFGRLTALFQKTACTGRRARYISFCSN